MKVVRIGPDEQRISPWRNGGGLTREILRVGPADAYAWRASLARIERDGAFSAFPQHHRVLALVDGGPLTLQLDADRILAVEPRLKAHALPTGAPPLARLGEAPASVFNLICDPAQVQAQLLPRPLVGGMLFFDQAGTDWLIYVLTGEAELRVGADHHWIGPLHGLLLQGEGSGARAVLDGGGEVALVRVCRN